MRGRFETSFAQNTDAFVFLLCFCPVRTLQMHFTRNLTLKYRCTGKRKRLPLRKWKRPPSQKKHFGNILHMPERFLYSLITCTCRGVNRLVHGVRQEPQKGNNSATAAQTLQRMRGHHPHENLDDKVRNEESREMVSDHLRTMHLCYAYYAKFEDLSEHKLQKLSLRLMIPILLVCGTLYGVAPICSAYIRSVFLKYTMLCLTCS